MRTSNELVRYRLGRDVVFARHDGSGRLLDLNRGRFFAADEIGTQMVGEVLESGPEEAAKKVAADYRAPLGQVKADVGRLVANLRRWRLVKAERTVPRIRIPGTLRLFMLLTWAWLCIKFLGWIGALRLCRRKQLPTTSPIAAVNSADLQELDLAIRAAAAWHPLNPQCKERALVGWHLLRNHYRFPAEIVVGAQFYPFCLHVWVECAGVTLTDNHFECDKYTPVVRYA